MDLSLFVRPGQRVTAVLWNKLVTACRAARILAGDGIRLRHTPDGTLISCSTWKPWNHPFKVSLGGTSATINRGLVGGIEPTIKDVPIGGDEESSKAQPRLEFKQPKLDKDGRGWIAIEATCEQKEWKVVSAVMVQVAELESKDASKALKMRALSHRRSLNSEAIDCLERALVGRPVGKHAQCDKPPKFAASPCGQPFFSVPAPHFPPRSWSGRISAPKCGRRRTWRRSRRSSDSRTRETRRC